MLLTTLALSALLSAAPNETCATASALADGHFVASTTDTSAGPASDCATADHYALWYTFSAPADALEDEMYTFRVRPAEGTDALYDPTLALYDTCDHQRACSDDDTLALTPRVDTYLSPGQTIHVRVAGWGDTRGGFVLDIARTAIVERPVNDDCADAIALVPGAPSPADTWNATGADLSSCGGEDRVDLWYTFTAPTAGDYTFAVTQQMIRAHYLTLYDDCSATPQTELACGFERATATLAAGQSIVVRLGTNPSTVDWFNVSVVTPAPAPPPNDLPANAIPIDQVPTTIDTTTDGATLDALDWGTDCGPRVNAAIWYTFTAPRDDVYVFDTSASALDDTVVALFDDCTNPELIVCNDVDGAGDHGRIDGYIEAGTSFCVAVAGHFRSETGGVTLDIAPLEAPPPNDDCADASPIQLGEQVFGRNYASVPVDITGACPGGNFALWYTFTAPHDGLFKFDTKTGDDGFDAWPDLALYDGCGPLDAALACSQDAHPSLAHDMRAGDTVMIRVSTVLVWRGTVPLHVGPAAAPAEPEPTPELAETGPPPESPPELLEVIEPGPEPDPQPEISEPNPETTERASPDAGCGCGTSRGANGAGPLGAALFLMLRALAYRLRRPGH